MVFKFSDDFDAYKMQPLATAPAQRQLLRNEVQGLGKIRVAGLQRQNIACRGDVAEFGRQQPDFAAAPVAVLERALNQVRADAQTRAEYELNLLPLIYGNFKPSSAARIHGMEFSGKLAAIQLAKAQAKTIADLEPIPEITPPPLPVPSNSSPPASKPMELETASP